MVSGIPLLRKDRGEEQAFVGYDTVESVRIGKYAEVVLDTDSREEAERLAREGNLRQAIRKGYIALLCELSDRKLIGLAQHKTNRDYLRDVRRRHALYQNMSGLTDNFERHWYGFEKADEKDWEEFRRRCGDTIKAI